MLCAGRPGAAGLPALDVTMPVVIIMLLPCSRSQDLLPPHMNGNMQRAPADVGPLPGPTCPEREQVRDWNSRVKLVDTYKQPKPTGRALTKSLTARSFWFIPQVKLFKLFTALPTSKPTEGGDVSGPQLYPVGESCKHHLAVALGLNLKLHRLYTINHASRSLCHGQ